VNNHSNCALKLFYIFSLLVCVIFSNVAYAQNVGISDDGATPNSNAMLDIVSPATGNGKGVLIPRITEAQRSTANAALAGGLLDNSGNLRGGAAQALLVYQTDGTEGFYYNTSTTATPNWVYIGTGGGSVTSITAGDGLAGGTITSTGTISMPNTGTAGTYTKVTTDAQGRVSSATTLADTDIPDLDAAKTTTGTFSTARIPNLDTAKITTGTFTDARIPDLNAAKITTGVLSATQGGLGTDVSAFTGLPYLSGGTSSEITITNAGRNIIDDADAATQRTTLGLGNIAIQNVTYTLQNANGTNGQFMQTNGAGSATWQTVTLPITGTTVAVGTGAAASSNGTAVGSAANGNTRATAIGYQANANNEGSSMGYQANAYLEGLAIGYKANGNNNCVAVGYTANGYCGTGPYSGAVSMGYRANSYSGNGKYSGGVAIGFSANARHNANENESGAVAVGFQANSFIRGAAVGWKAAGYNRGVAVGYLASGSNYGVGVGYKANAALGSYATAIGYMANGGGSKNFTLAKGAYSKCKRYNEEWKSSDGWDNKWGYGQVNFHGTTTTASATEIFLGGRTDEQFTLADNSAVTFQAMITGINTNTGDSSGWRCWGVIKRRSGAATTALIGAISLDAKTQGGLTTDPAFTADTANGSLKLQVTGVNANTCVWNAAVTYSETRQTAQQ